MVPLLLALAALIVLLQIGLMAMVRKLVAQIDHERRRISALEDRLDQPAPVSGVRGDAAAGTFRLVTEGALPAGSAAPRHSAPPAAAGTGATLPREPVASPDAAPGPRAKSPVAAAQAATASVPAAGSEPAQAALRAQMLDLMQQLVQQGLTVREIAARCGLSEAEAELMLSLRGTQR